MTGPGQMNAQPPARSGATLSPVVTIAIAVIAAVLASVITTLVVGGGRQSTSAPQPTLEAKASAGPNASSATGSASAASPNSGTVAGAAAPGTAAAAAAKVSKSVVVVAAKDGVGSGFVVSPDGLILTNHHVVEEDKKVTVTFGDGRTATGNVIAVDTLTDLALVRVKLPDLTAVELGRSGDLAVGDPVIAIGNPLGSFANSVTSGVVSGLSRTTFLDDSGEYRNMLQTDAAINQGNSGGPLVDFAGRVVGVNTLSAIGNFGAEGLGFAIPIDVARPIIDEAIAGKPLTRPFLGVRYTPVDLGVKQEQKLTVDHGALLQKQPADSGGFRAAVVAGSPADAAGLRDGDVIVGIEDQTIDFQHPLEIVVVQFAAGQTVTLHIVRDGAERDVSVKLGTKR